MARLKFFTVDVFTTRRFAGNPLAIVEGADGLSTGAMQAIAREFNLSETIFIQTPDDPAHTAKVRIFFPTAEIPFAGHPTIGCAIHLAAKDRSGDFETHIVLEEVAGLVPVNVARKRGEVRAQFTAPVIPHGHSGKAPDATVAAAALGLSPGEIGFGAHKPGVWIGGPAFLFLPLASRAALAKARPSEPAWGEMTGVAKVDAAYCYVAGGENDATDFSARMFAPRAGTPEDPATGSASALLAAQFLASAVLNDGLNAFALEQGYDMGRPSDISLEVDVAGNAITAVRISGSSVAVSEGEIEAG